MLWDTNTIQATVRYQLKVADMFYKCFVKPSKKRNHIDFLGLTRVGFFLSKFFNGLGDLHIQCLRSILFTDGTRFIVIMHLCRGSAKLLSLPWGFCSMCNHRIVLVGAQDWYKRLSLWQKKKWKEGCFLHLGKNEIFFRHYSFSFDDLGLAPVDTKCTSDANVGAATVCRALCIASGLVIMSQAQYNSRQFCQLRFASCVVMLCCISVSCDERLFFGIYRIALS